VRELNLHLKQLGRTRGELKRAPLRASRLTAVPNRILRPGADMKM